MVKKPLPPKGKKAKPEAKPKSNQAKVVEELRARLLGEVVIGQLDQVQPNDWNPNVVDKATLRSIKEDFKREGWVTSQALLIWGTDEKGKTQNIIIDGEHRWQIARELKWETGPMVFLNGLTREQASKWTIKLDNKRGKFDDKLLSTMLRTYEATEETAFELGFDTETFMKLMAAPVVESGAATSSSKSQNNDAVNRTTGGAPAGLPNVRTVQLLYTTEQHELFVAATRRLNMSGKQSVAVVVLEALKAAAASIKVA